MLNDTSRARIGGKAQGLHCLMELGLRVPPWRVFSSETAEVFTEAMALQLWDALYAETFAGLAVRSSAAAEDCRERSWAGQFKTIFASAPGEVAEAVRQVAASGPAAQEPGKHRVSVIVQAWVRARISGVLFSAHPAQARPDTAYLEVVNGAGQTLADGSRVPSRFEISVRTRSVLKAEQGRDGPEMIEPAVLESLLGPLPRMEQRFDAALDIEWAVDASGVWFLQARPITALQLDASMRPLACATSWFFDQRFAEPIRPLTRTTLLPLIARVSVGEALAMRGEKASGPLPRYYAGQAYVAHDVYRKMLAGAPRWWLTPDLRQLFPKSCGCAEWKCSWRSMIHYAWCALRGVWRERRDVFRNRTVWNDFRGTLNARLHSLEACPGNSESEWMEHWCALEALNERFLRIHRWSYLWANYVYRAVMGTLVFLPQTMREDCTRALHHRAAACSREANDALTRFLQDPSDDALERFVSLYGHRSESLDYAIPSWGELARGGALARHYAAASSLASSLEGADAPPRSQACGKLNLPARLLEMREEQRFEWERILACQRRMLLGAAKALAARGALDGQEDVWFLEWDEFLGMMFRQQPAPREAIEARRHEHCLYALVEKPLFLGPLSASAQEQPQTLQGIGASAGSAHGKVLVLRHFSDVPETLDTPVIGVFVCLDPAWTPVLPRFSGLIVERGGVLSHAAILAREYHIPMVIGAEGASTQLHTGMDVSMDGGTGTITAIEPGRVSGQASGEN